MSAHKFWDSDLRRDPSLLSVAIEYARDYCGDFEVMVGAQSVVHETGTLPLPLARMVLNCMRSDPTVIAPSKPRLKDYRRHPAGSALGDNVVEMRPIGGGIEVPDDDDEDDLEERLTKEERFLPRWSKTMKARVKTPYAMSKKRGAVLHKVSQEPDSPWGRPNHYCEFIISDRAAWNRAEDARDQAAMDALVRDKVILHVSTACKSSTLGLVDPILLDHKPDGVTFCKSGCFQKWCRDCKHLTRVKEDQPPETEIIHCEHCRGTNLR